MTTGKTSGRVPDAVICAIVCISAAVFAGVSGIPGTVSAEAGSVVVTICPSGGGDTVTETVGEDQSYTTPSAPADVPEGYIFAGWEVPGHDGIFYGCSVQIPYADLCGIAVDGQVELRGKLIPVLDASWGECRSVTEYVRSGLPISVDVSGGCPEGYTVLSAVFGQVPPGMSAEYSGGRVSIVPDGVPATGHVPLTVSLTYGSDGGDKCIVFWTIWIGIVPELVIS